MAKKPIGGATGSVYDVHPGVMMVQKWVAELRSKTGRSLAEWVALVRKEAPADEAGRRDWLKKTHGLGTNSAWWIAERADPAKAKSVDDDPDAYLHAAAGYVDALYAGPKAGLRPIHDELLRLARTSGRDVRVCPCTTMVPIFRNHVIAQIKPSTRTRIDFGLALAKYKGKLPARLIDTGGLAKKDRITHRIAITSMEEVDAEVWKWLATAYGLDAE